MLSSKGATGRALNGQLDLALQFAGGIVTAHFPAIPAGAPHASFAVHGQAVRGTRLVVAEQHKRAAVRDRAGRRVEIIGIDHAARRIGIVHRPVVQAPPDAVRHADAGFQRVNGKAGVEAIQGARRAGRDRPGPKTTLAVNDAVVETRVRFAGFRVGDELGRAGAADSRRQSHRASP